MSWLPLLTTLLLAVPSEEVARVGAAVITRGDVEARLAFMRSSGDPGGVLDAVNGLIGERLLEDEARRLGLEASPAVRGAVEAERRRLAARLFEERELTAGVRVGEPELRALYHSTADSVRLDLLVFDGPEAAAAARGRAARTGDLAAEVRGAVARPPGALTIRAQLDPRLAPLAFQAPIGALQGPVEASVGWAVFKVLERHVGDEGGFQAERASLLRHATQAVLTRARAHLVQQLRAGQAVALDEPFLDALPKGTRATAAQRAHVIATVGGRPLTYGEVLPAIERLAAATSHTASAAVKRQVAWQEVDARLFEDAAVARGYAGDPGVVARLPAIEAAALAQALAARITAAVPPPTEAEVEAFYEGAKGQFGQPLERARPAVVAALTGRKRGEAILAKVRELRGRSSVQVQQVALDAIPGGR